MRISAVPTDAAYHPAVNYMAVTLNGVKVASWIEVDDVAGTVRVARFQHGEPVTETRRGLVRVQVPHEHAFYPGWPALPAHFIGRPIFKAPRGFRRMHWA